MASRRSQPYRKTADRAPGGALSAMLAGRTAFGQNPADATRAAQTGAFEAPDFSTVGSRIGMLLRQAQGVKPYVKKRPRG
jgi:hypothetical protein